MSDRPTRTSDALRRLAEGIAELTSSDAWRRYLDAARLFHNYSFGNTVLILSQSPAAARCAGFHTWRKLGRAVQKGSKAIWILAPITVSRSDDGEDVAGTEEDAAARVVVSWKAVPVFDVSATDGAPLPTVATRLHGDDPARSYEQLHGVARGLGYSVEEDYLAGERNGDCDCTARHIRVEVRNDERQMVKTLCHELAHACMHSEFDGPRELAECEAARIAYIVGDSLGLDSSAYSFGYVAAWAGGGEGAQQAIAAAGTRIQDAAHRIITALEETERSVAA